MAKYLADTSDKCPHCGIGVRFENALYHSKLDTPISFTDFDIPLPSFRLYSSKCPDCLGLILTLVRIVRQGPGVVDSEKEFVIYPRTTLRSPVSPLVPKSIRRDYEEAALTLLISPKASAALSRRCLQAMLSDAGGSNNKNLAGQIDEVMPKLPEYLAEQIDAIRNIGNFAAHPIKADQGGTIVEVEPGEAEWNLDVLDLLFAFYYVQPAKAREKRDALNKKLDAAGKPPMKKP